MKDEVMERKNTLAKACHEVHKCLQSTIQAINNHVVALHKEDLPKSMVDRSAEFGHRLITMKTAWGNVFPDRHIGTIEGDDAGMVAMIQYQGVSARLFVKGILTRSEHTPDGVARLEKIRDQINASED